MVVVDANVIVRLLAKDHPEHFQKALEFFRTRRDIYLMESVVAECYYVLLKIYRLPKERIVEDLVRLLDLPNIVANKALLGETLAILRERNIDFVDAMLCARARIFGDEIFSFDKKVVQCAKL